MLEFLNKSEFVSLFTKKLKLLLFVFFIDKVEKGDLEGNLSLDHAFSQKLPIFSILGLSTSYQASGMIPSNVKENKFSLKKMFL